MAKFFVVRINAEVVVPYQTLARGINCTQKDTVVIVQFLLDNGHYELVSGCNGLDSQDADDVFHKLNSCEDTYMTVSDVIIWSNGKRELCLNNGWATI